MPTHNANDPIAASSKQHGYESSDVSVQGVVVFLVSLSIFIGVFFLFCFGMGKVINNELVKRDGPPNKWNDLDHASGSASRNMASNPAMEQQQLQQMTARFPTPRLQTDDGNQDLADMHVRESLLLDHYTWIDRGQGKIRIPIDRAMEIIAQRGLPVSGTVQAAAPKAGEGASMGESNPATAASEPTPSVQAPLTNGFAPTGYEQELANTRRTNGEVAQSSATP